MRMSLRLIGVLTLALTLLVAPPASATEKTGQQLIGTWIGTYAGYSDGSFISGSERIVITQARGPAAKGTWQFKPKGGTWTKPRPLQLVVMVSDGADITVRGQDSQGFYDGRLTADGRLTFTYVGLAPRKQALLFELRKRSG